MGSNWNVNPRVIERLKQQLFLRKLWVIYRCIGLPDYRFTGLYDHRIIDLPVYRLTGLSVCRIIGLPDYWFNGLSVYRLMGLQNYRFTRL
jgi:hypothetical protein